MSNIFISHRTSDLVEAERLATALRMAGHTVWLDKWNINIGDSIIEKMNQALEVASHLIICYSSSGVTSPWMSREWMSALARKLNGHNIKLIPVILSGGVPPAILADLKWIDLSQNWTNRIQDLLRAL